MKRADWTWMRASVALVSTAALRLKHGLPGGSGLYYIAPIPAPVLVPIKA